MNLSGWMRIGFDILKAVPMAILAVEQMKVAWRESREKEDAAVTIVKTITDTAQTMTPVVEGIVRNVIKESVALQNEAAKQQQPSEIKK